MKKSIYYLLCISLCTYANTSSAQILDKIKAKAKQRLEQRTDEAIDKGIDKIEEAPKAKTEPKYASNKEEVEPPKGNQTLKSFSKFDFVPGEDIIYYENFDKEVLSEFPAKWNTDNNGQVTTIEEMNGKWLRMFGGSSYLSSNTKQFAQNFTAEFDLVLSPTETTTEAPFSINLVSVAGNTTDANWLDESRQEQSSKGFMNINFTYTDEGNVSTRVTTTKDGKRHQQTPQLETKSLFTNRYNRPIHIAIWVQDQRMRLWVDEKKVYDLPKVIPPGVRFNQIGFAGSTGWDNTDEYGIYVTNIKIAEAKPDTRNKLLTEGKWATSGILFNTGSDAIKPESYGVLKEIAALLQENASLKVNIIGHTDSDGDDAKNLELSKKRAAAVKKALTNEFKIDASRMQTDGQGETKPVADNKTQEGKAKNRRVEFVKL